MKIAMLIAAVLTGAFYWYTRHTQIQVLKKKRNLTKKKPLEKKRDFKCVTIHTDANPCAAAKALEKMPILINEASGLPLAGCYKDSCNCRFSSRDDRRIVDRRNARYLEINPMNIHYYRRENRDRRIRVN